MKTVPALFAAQPDDGYGAPEVHLTSDGRDIFVTSDLHLGGGRSPDGRYRGTENFFADEAYVRFLRYAQSVAEKKPILIINGDFIDFLRVKETPQSNNDYAVWQSELQAIGIQKTVDELRQAVADKEHKFGLKTNDYKSIWKLYLVSIGHRTLFAGLADWIASGHSLIITKGNHDLEWYYKHVREYLAFVLARATAQITGDPIEDTLVDVLQRLLFIDDTLIVDEACYIEHGHRYDKFSSVVGDPLLENSEELNIPFGSFFNRYLINRIELVYPYLDNIKPAENLLPLLMRERFPLALKVLFSHVPLLIQSIKKRYFVYMFRDVFWYVIALGLPVGLTLWSLYNNIDAGVISFARTSFTSVVQEITKGVAALVGSYLLSRIVAFFRLQEPTSLAEYADAKFRERPELELITMGHTHHADQFITDKGKWFFNTGTWIPIIETSSGNISHDRTFVFLHIVNKNNKLTCESLARWNDDAGRPDPLVLINKKE